MIQRPASLLRRCCLLSVFCIGAGIAPVNQAIGSLDCNAIQPPEAYDGYNPCPYGLTLQIDERFDSFNESLWERSTGGFPDNSCRFIDNDGHVRVADGELNLVMEHKEVPASYSRHELKMVERKMCASGELRTKEPFGPYGRLEARLRTPDSSGFIQSLFFFHFYKNPWQELDIELQGRLPDSVSSNIITNHAVSHEECDSYSCTKNSERHAKLPFRHSEDWHVYTIDWLPDVARFYVDGQMVRETTKEEVELAGGNYPNIPSTILMNFWLSNPKISQYFGGNWSYDQLPIVARYDWVRFYQLDDVLTTRCYYRGQCPYQYWGAANPFSDANLSSELSSGE